MPFKEIIAVYNEKYTELINKKNVELLIIKTAGICNYHSAVRG
jgi:hypothetical protein